MSFTTEGYESFPSLYQDTQRLHEVGEWPYDVLENRVNEYGAFLTRQDLMPRAKATANRLLDHYLFELAYRDQVWDEVIKKGGVCEQVV